jgi:ABC-2 type transport system ATP-binding protein
VIVFEDVAARRRPLALSSVTHVWEAGCHAVVGSRRDGGPLLLALVAGLVRPRTGRLRVLGGVPTDAVVRRQVARVPLDPVLPDAMRVGEALRLASAVRRETPGDARERLSTLGIEALADRAVRSLSRAEARAVTLVEALTSPTVRILLLEEPLVTMDPRASARLPMALRERGRQGCAIVATTTSMRDAGELADDWLALRAGAVVGHGACVDTLVEAQPEGAHLRLVLRDAGEVAALLAALTTTLGEAGDIDLIERDGGSLRLRGRDATALARAAGRAALEADVDIAELRIDPVPARSPTASTKSPNGLAAGGAS